MKKYFYLAVIAAMFTACSEQEAVEIISEESSGTENFNYSLYSTSEILELGGSKYVDLLRNQSIAIEEEGGTTTVETIAGIFAECVDGAYCIEFESTCMIIVTFTRDVNVISPNITNYLNAEVTELRTTGPESSVHPLVVVNTASTTHPGASTHIIY